MKKQLIKTLSEVISADILIRLLIEKLREPKAKTTFEGFEVFYEKDETVKFSWSLEITRNDKRL